MVHWQFFWIIGISDFELLEQFFYLADYWNSDYRTSERGKLSDYKMSDSKHKLSDYRYWIINKNYWLYSTGRNERPKIVRGISSLPGSAQRRRWGRWGGWLWTVWGGLSATWTTAGSETPAEHCSGNQERWMENDRNTEYRYLFR